MELNESQLQAIKHKEGPMLVLAGPGSGKTLVITKRTKYLITECGINPNHILVITFTKAAASEMKERFQRETEGSGCVNFGTFHAVFFTILKYAYRYTGANIVREDQKKQFFRDAIHKTELEIEDENEFISGISNEISLVKSEQMDITHYYSMNCPEAVFQNIYQEYESYLRQSNLIDFDDMLVLCYELLTQREDILKLWQEKFQYILIDEFQDINRIQYQIIKLLAKPQNNLFVVGDDDQSIYRFRGAKPDIMLSFPKDFKDAKQVLLNINYRCSANITAAALRVIENNTKRFHKKISALRTEGAPVAIRCFATLEDENKAVLNEIAHLYQAGIPYSEIAVLFRTNVQARALVGKLMEYNVPFKMKDMLPNLFEHWIAQDVLAYIRLSGSQMERKDFLRIANRPKRYISRECLNELLIDFAKLKQYYHDKDWMAERVDKLEYDLKFIADKTPYAAIRYIRKGIGYDAYIKEYADYRRIKVQELYDLLDEIEASAKEFETAGEWFAYINEYGEELRRQQNSQRQKEDAVSMATMHSSKGLEYKAVFVIDVNEAIIPHHKALILEDLEEERRMFYVALTRAKDFLAVYSVKERYNKNLERSRFVGEILVDKSALVPGAKIVHKTYGNGKIIKNEDGKLILYFDKLKKERILDLNYCVSNALIEVIPNEKNML